MLCERTFLMQQRHYHSEFIGDSFLCIDQVTTFERKRPVYFQAAGFVTPTRETVLVVSPVSLCLHLMSVLL